MGAVIVNGIDTLLGRRIASVAGTGGRPLLDAERVIAGDLPAGDGTGPVDVVILAPGRGPDVDGSGLGGVDVDGAARLLAVLDAVPVRQVVLVSTAMVYGAWPTNPLPLSEDAVLRPNPGSHFAADNAELERLVGEWCERREGTRLAVLRPTLTVSADPEATSWMERSLWHTPSARQGDLDPPGQFLLLDDLVAAVTHALDAGLQGPFNVAPDGWLRVQRQVELVGKGGLLRIPGPLADPIARARWRWRLTSTPPEVLPYTMHPWVVANDRLKATGWEPTSSNEEAFVAVNRPGWWSSLHGRRRQEVALAGLLGAVGGIVTLVVVLVRRAGRHGAKSASSSSR